MLDKTFSRVSLPEPGGADDRDMIVKHINGKLGREEAQFPGIPAKDGHDGKHHEIQSASRRREPPPLPAWRSGSVEWRRAHTVRSRCRSPALALATMPWK